MSEVERGLPRFAFLGKSQRGKKPRSTTQDAASARHLQECTTATHQIGFRTVPP